MLDPWIIEEIKRREEESRRQPAVVELPLHGPSEKPEEREERPAPGRDEAPRGVVIIEF